MATDQTLSAEPMAQFARRTFTQLHQAILSHEAGARAGDVEAIHDMRVGIRRLRVALSNFAVCLDAGKRKELRTQMERLANSLGAVRDLDVLLAALQINPAINTDKERQARRTLHTRLRTRRKQRHREFLTHLQSEEYAQFTREFATDSEELTANNEKEARGQTA
ncbi:MAG: CHAD domain-containing protein [Acidobacteria bacterium]|nr:CHAD domain-containing protein [Acidobacteriota bacterium]